MDGDVEANVVPDRGNFGLGGHRTTASRCLSASRVSHDRRRSWHFKFLLVLVHRNSKQVVFCCPASAEGVTSVDAYSWGVSMPSVAFLAGVVICLILAPFRPLRENLAAS